MRSAHKAAAVRTTFTAHAHSFPFRLLLVRKQLQDSLDFAPLAMATPYRKAREAIRLPTSIADTHEEISARFGIMFSQ